ncbi:MAG: hypothetical protein HYT06_00590 [Candidatus Levybacteria bacterium]|nr:hypothetical protein [Candidatus Levybacteria bacterium]
MKIEARDGVGGPADYQLHRQGVGEPVVVNPTHLRVTNRASIDSVAGVMQGVVDSRRQRAQSRSARQ